MSTNPQRSAKAPELGPGDETAAGKRLPGFADGQPARAAVARRAALQDAIDRDPLGLALLDRAGRIEICNRLFAVLRATGDPKLESVLGLFGPAPAPAGGSAPAGGPPPAKSPFGRMAGGPDPRLARDGEPCARFGLRLADGSWLTLEERRCDAGGSLVARLTSAPTHDADEPLFALSPLPAYAFACDTLEFLAVNDAALAFYGYGRAAFMRLTLSAIRPAREHQRMVEHASSRRPETLGSGEWIHLASDGREIGVGTQHCPLLYKGRSAVLVTVTDQSERDRAERALVQTRAFLDTVVDTVPIAIFGKDMSDDGRYILYNRSGAELVGRPNDQLVGLRDDEIFPAEMAARFRAQDAMTLHSGRLQVIEEETVLRGDGTTRIIQTKKLPIPDAADGRMRYLLGIAEDITDRRLYEARIVHMAHHDPLTDLPNRVLFRKAVEAALFRGMHYGENSAVLYLDLDDFKAVNDALGHPIGDLVLRAVSERLRTILRGSDMAARLGGDEFAVLQASVEAPASSRALAALIIDKLGAPYQIQDHRFTVGVSVGIARAPTDGNDPETLLKNADLALYRAKHAGRGTLRFFDPSMTKSPRAASEL